MKWLINKALTIVIKEVIKPLKIKDRVKNTLKTNSENLLNEIKNTIRKRLEELF